MLESLKSKLGGGGGASPSGAAPKSSLLPTQLVQSALQTIDDGTPSLSWKQRAIGFGICMGVGLLLSFMVRWHSIVSPHLARPTGDCRPAPPAPLCAPPTACPRHLSSLSPPSSSTMIPPTHTHKQTHTHNTHP